jgi:hypothetical protein
MTAERIIAALRWVATAKRAAATAAVKPVLIQDPRGISFARFPHSAVATERDLSPRVERAGCAEQAYETANPVRANAFELTRIFGNRLNAWARHYPWRHPPTPRRQPHHFAARCLSIAQSHSKLVAELASLVSHLGSVSSECAISRTK